ncbi:hypothetical protein DSTSK_32110 [Desulforhabdus sp. TSK]|nr:hypothetical protein DSTSK_32110 [Desulforhabdus sp. TSK]
MELLKSHSATNEHHTNECHKKRLRSDLLSL